MVARSEAQAPDEVLALLRRATLGRSVRDTWRWLMRAIGWGSLVYMIAWSVLLLVAAIQSLTPLPAGVAAALLRWSPPVGAVALAVALHLAAAARVTPLWLDRRDLAHLAPSAATARAILGWPAWRTILPGMLGAVACGAALSLTLPRLLGADAAAALLTLPALVVLAPALRWRAAVAERRDSASWVLVAIAWIAAAGAAVGSWLGHDAWAAWLAAPIAATIGALPPGAGLAVGVLSLAAAVLFAVRTAATTTATIPGVVLRQSLALGELRAIATLRGMSLLTMTAIDPGGAFAAGRLRDELRGRRGARSPRWRPALPRRGGATSAFAWLGVVRAWRASPWTLVGVAFACVAAVLAMPPAGPFGGAALAPSLALAWVAAQLYPGRVPWPAFAIDGRARTLASILLVAVPTWVLATLTGLARPLVGAPAAPDDWLVIPLALAAGAVVDIVGGRSPSARSPTVWLAAAMLVAAPAALLGWAGVEAIMAAPIVAAVWGATAWLRVLAASPVG